VVSQGVLLLAWWEDEPVGCVALGALDASTGEVKRMYVRAAARGRGIGAALLDALLGHARALGHARVRLDTAPELTPAIALYERFGFRPIAPYRESQCLAALYFEREV
jgi:GNAT superfamily N-acetyltransferase